MFAFSLNEQSRNRYQKASVAKSRCHVSEFMPVTPHFGSGRKRHRHAHGRPAGNLPLAAWFNCWLYQRMLMKIIGE